MNKGSFQWMKSFNKTMVLKKIRTDGPISRAAIAKETKLTPPTVSKLVSELLEAELVIESEQGASIGGRKPTLLIINRERFYFIGLDIGAKLIRAVLVDLSGTVVAEQEQALPIDKMEKQVLIKEMKRAIHKLATAHSEKEIVGIGVGMHGVVEVESGTSLFAPSFQLRDIPIKQELEAEFDVLVKVDNDVRALAFGEYWLTGERHNETIVTINIGHGVGAGIVVNGKLFHGEHDLAGEVGHMSIDLNGKLCSCGNFGCWQTLITGPAIANRAIEQLQASNHSLLQPFNTNEMDGKHVYEAAVKGDTLAMEVLDETGVYIGIGLTNIIHMLNPTKLIIGGGVAQAETFIMPAIRRTIEQRGLTKHAKFTPIDCSKQGTFGTAIGAAALVLGEIFESNHAEEA